MSLKRTYKNNSLNPRITEKNLKNIQKQLNELKEDFNKYQGNYFKKEITGIKKAVQDVKEELSQIYGKSQKRKSTEIKSWKQKVP
jgi:archaellum component FlaC